VAHGERTGCDVTRDRAEERPPTKDRALGLTERGLAAPAIACDVIAGHWRFGGEVECTERATLDHSDTGA
jgi:hypothetical protein